MKKVVKNLSNTLLLALATTTAVAAEPREAPGTPLMLAENTPATAAIVVEAETVVSMKQTAKVLNKTLDEVSADLAAEIELPFEAMFTAQ